MGWRWKPSHSQAREFARNMQDADFAADYYARKEAKAEKRRAGSQFDYASAGGFYVPTKHQHDKAMHFIFNKEISHEQHEACNFVINGYSMNERVHHDYIHIVNELIRNENYVLKL